MADTGKIALLRQKDEWLSSVVNEKVQRPWAAAEALTRPHGGISVVAQATGLSRTTLAAGRRELRADRLRAAPGATPAERVRRPGGGRWGVIQHDPAMLQARAALGEPRTRGAPPSPLQWTGKSTRRRAAELQRPGHALSPQTVALLPQALG